MVIDVFSHIFPDEYLDFFTQIPPFLADRLSRSKGFRDMDYRIEMMDKQGVNMHVLTLGRPHLDNIKNPKASLAKIAEAANNGIAKIAERYPDRFAAVGTVSLLDVDAAIDEVDRCIEELGMVGIQVLSNVGGKPLDLREFDPLYERLSHHDVALWIHPTDMGKVYDWMNEFNLHSILGWGIDTSLAMFRIMRGGVLERYPNLKIITHHMGVLIPFLARRIEISIMREGKDGLPPSPLTKRPMEYLKMFYVDTATGPWKPALVCSQMFFGSDHILFGSDYPYLGESNPKDLIDSIEELNIPEEEKKMILGQNAMRLLKIK
jgi:predicted TIM-barrel fold metal-dependent hydrolase